MDLYNSEKQRAKRYATIRYQEALSHNERVTAMRRQAAQRILQASEDKKQEVAEQQVEEIATGSAAGISTAIDATSARTTLMNAAKSKAEEALKNSVKQKVDSVVKDAAEEASGEASKKGERIVGRKFARKALSAGGTFMNVGQGAYDLYKDTNGFKGDFHLEGANDLERASNALQIASGVADSLGVVTAQPEIIALGAALGAASAVTGAIGGQEEIEQKSVKQQADLKSKTDKIKSDMNKLKFVDADKVKQQALQSAKSSMGLGEPKGVSSRVVKKVSA